MEVSRWWGGVSLVDFLIECPIVLGSCEAIGEIEVYFLAERGVDGWPEKRVLLLMIIFSSFWR